jgi:DNA invertase Pin-like site-specific DNA recombinase
MKTRTFAYCRVSGASQESGDGFQRQERSIRQYAKTHRVQIVQTFRDQVSGTKDETERPEFERMISEMLRDSVRCVIVEDLSRLAREFRIQESLLIFLAFKGIDLISARTEENVTQSIQADPMRKALVQIQGIFSELDKNLLIGKLRAAREAKRKQYGKCEGRKSYKEKAPELLREIRRLRRKRKGRRRMTYESVAASLNESGLRNMSGGLWTSNNVRGLLHREKRRS